MADINDGGLAFPASRFEEVTYTNGDTKEAAVHYPGMSMRDYFAGQALVGMMQAMRPYSGNYERSAREAYKQADAMLAARSSSPSEAEGE